MKKVLIATGIFPPQVGGPATYSKFLLDSLPKDDFVVKVVNFGDVLFFPKIIRHIFYFFKLIFKSNSFDIIFAQDPVSVGLPALFAAKILRKKFFLKIVGDYAWEQGVQHHGVTDLLDEFSLEYKKYSFLTRMLKRIEIFVANGAHRIIVPSHYLKKIVSNWGVNINKISVIYNAFEIPNAIKSKEKLRDEFFNTRPVIVSAGRLVPWKGFATLIDLVPEIIKQFPEIKLYIIGDGPDRAILEKKINDAELKDRVIITGKMEQKDLFEYITAADLFVLNTSYEGFSHQILEVLALGTPIITTSVGGNGEIIEDGSEGNLVEYNNKKELFSSIINLLNNPEKGDQYVRRGKEKLKEFTKSKMLDKLSKILSE